MSVKLNLKGLLRVSSIEEPESEKKFRHRIFQSVILPLFFIFLFICYGVTPFLYDSIASFYKSPITINIHLILLVLGTLHLFNKKGKPALVTGVLPILFGLISYVRFFHEYIIEAYPYVPFYAATLVTLFAGTFLSLKRAVYSIIGYTLLFNGLAFVGVLSVSDFFTRMAIVYLFCPMMISFILARRNIFHQLEVQSIELGNMSNVQMLAELSGGIAHEINNPLFIISGLSDRIKRRYDKKIEPEGLNSKNYEDIIKIRETVDRISSITNSLLEVARKTTSPSF